jgi:hypothetical protein
VAIVRRLVEKEGRKKMANGLAAALSNHGLVLQELTRKEEAEACQRESVAIRQILATVHPDFEKEPL